MQPSSRRRSLFRSTRSWNRERDKLLRLAERFDRPLLLSEVGYPSLPTAGEFPWNYVASNGTPADHRAQADCYEAVFASWGEVIADPAGLAMGLFCYHWDPYHRGGKYDTGYGVMVESLRRNPAKRLFSTGSPLT